MAHIVYSVTATKYNLTKLSAWGGACYNAYGDARLGVDGKFIKKEEWGRDFSGQEERKRDT